MGERFTRRHEDAKLRKDDAMKERPILFSGPMVRAILEGRKTMTRRIVKRQPSGFDLNDKPVFGACPYGAPGDRLWVKETWLPIYIDSLPGHVIDKTQYRADETNPLSGAGMWHPSIYMPRKRSRIKLEITGVRVERLHTITEEDAKAEGIMGATVGEYGDRGCFITDFAYLWSKINGHESWDANPWVWVVEFKRV